MTTNRQHIEADIKEIKEKLNLIMEALSIGKQPRLSDRDLDAMAKANVLRFQQRIAKRGKKNVRKRNNTK